MLSFRENVKKQLRHYRRHCLRSRGNKRTTVKTYMMNILEFINSEEIQEEIQLKKQYKEKTRGYQWRK